MAAAADRNPQRPEAPNVAKSGPRAALDPAAKHGLLADQDPQASPAAAPCSAERLGADREAADPRLEGVADDDRPLHERVDPAAVGEAAGPVKGVEVVVALGMLDAPGRDP